MLSNIVSYPKKSVCILRNLMKLSANKVLEIKPIYSRVLCPIGLLMKNLGANMLLNIYLFI